MSDALERIVVDLDGRQFDFWSEVSIDYSVEQAARSATLVCSDLGGSLPIRPSARCRLLASGDLVLTGYVRDVKPAHGERDHSVTVSIVSKTVDLVEASIDHPSGFLKDVDLKAIAEGFDTAGVGVEVQGSFPVEPRRFVNTGESWFQHMEPLARAHDAFIYDDENGRAVIATKPRGRHAGTLSIGAGGNIIAASATLTEQGRFAKVKVRGQASRGETPAALQPEAEAEDEEVGRERTQIVVLESEATPEKLEKRAKQAVRRAAGYSREANVTVSGWRDSGGKIFMPHFTIMLDDPRIYCVQDMAIKTVRLTQSIQNGGPGTRAELSLVDPRALGGGKPAASKSDKAFETPEPQPKVSEPSNGEPPILTPLPGA